MLVGILAMVLAAQGGAAGPPPVSAVSRPVVPQSHADATVLGTVGAEDANEIEVATLAKAKASNGDAKSYAALLLHDHQQSLTSGTNLAKRLHITRLLPADSAMARAHAAEMKELNVLSGTAFDKALMQYEFAGHKAAVAKDSVLIARATGAAVKDFVRSLVPIHATHQDIAAKWLAAHP
jgi:predicted outer membrane protein